MATQLNAIATASDSYAIAFNAYPGWVSDRSLHDGGARDFTGTENLVLSLLGGVGRHDAPVSPSTARVPSLADGESIDLADIGLGPGTRDGKRYGSFYAPKANELAAITGTTGTDNDIPEFLDPISQLPILYYRVDPEHKLEHAGAWYDGKVALGRETNRDYFEAQALTNPSGKSFNQSRSLLRTQPDGGGPADALLTKVALNPQQRKILNGFVLISAGADGVYFSSDQRGTRIDDGVIDTLEGFDDLTRVVGQ